MAENSGGIQNVGSLSASDFKRIIQESSMLDELGLTPDAKRKLEEQFNEVAARGEQSSVANQATRAANIAGGQDQITKGGDAERKAAGRSVQADATGTEPATSPPQTPVQSNPKGYAQIAYTTPLYETVAGKKKGTFVKRLIRPHDAFELLKRYESGTATPEDKARVHKMRDENNLIIDEENKTVVKAFGLNSTGSGTGGFQSGGQGSGSGGTSQGAVDQIKGLLGRLSGVDGNTMVGLGAIGGVVDGGAAGAALGTAAAVGAVAGNGLRGVGYGTASVVGGVAGLLGFTGLESNMKSVMNGIMRNYKDDQMRSMIHNPGIPIETLLAMFFAHMSEKYEQKLREKMDEVVVQEQREQSRQNREKIIGAVGSLASAVPLLGGAFKGIIEGMGAAYNKIENAANGQTKSATVLMTEVQVIMHQWKQMLEMTSNLIKALHDMAMTPIRNLR